MTHSLPTQTTSTKPLIETASIKTQAGSPKSDISESRALNRARFIKNPLVTGAFITPQKLISDLEKTITGCGLHFEIWDSKRTDLMLSVAEQLTGSDRTRFMELAGVNEQYANECLISCSQIINKIQREMI